jgi:protein-L-isoaspartate(D-aspartate) O-methyltransferase
MKNRIQGKGMFRLSLSVMVVFGLSLMASFSQSVVAVQSEDAAFLAEREAMVTQQLVRRGIQDERVLHAMMSVPRHKFVPHRHIRSAYGDSPLPIGYGQTISQPYIVAYMTEVLRLNSMSKVLEIGTGSGYQAAILSPLAKEVYSIEIIPELAGEASALLKRLGYHNVEVATGDGYYGWKEHAPFDAIIVTAAAGHIPPALVEQLKNNGRMVIPVGGPFTVQNLVLIQKDQNGRITTRNLMPVRFVPLTGKHY